MARAVTSSTAAATWSSGAALPDAGTTAAARLTEAVDPQRHPQMYAARAHLPAPHHEQHFDYGLLLVIAGIRGGRTERPPRRT